MKQFLRKISAIVLAFVVLFSTMSFTISEHYCGGDLVDSALFSKVDICNMDMYMQKTSSENDSCDNNNNCCKDIIKHIEGQSDLKVDFSSLNFEQQVFVASFTYAYLNLFEGLAVNIIPFKYYTPPLLITDIHVLDQVFLI
ncbi:MAG: hypothetical protein APF83_07430 [Lutibacter sp. BRH_c52]|nr:MAG: hypothetical protein APF83_07430 [Lutibacter sp. BRH_c52]HCE54250.1 hypothetical protein [Lutibacter sp.]